ncbi:MAG: tRNA threonylcarbamoyladenosine biosynthesis protein RimN, partial [Pseudomonadota bacterium]|nr:tRNA threonylcarbamoyladenosine biosynthesis protein RimN [Pseudomonadota bacterium]
AYGGVIVSTSANPAGADAARTAAQVQAYFADQVPCVIGEVGQLARPSMIRDAVTGQVLRE